MNAIIPGKKGNQFNLAVQARRQPGSTFKTFVLTTAVAKGINPAYELLRLGAVRVPADPKVKPWDVYDVRPQLRRLDLDRAGDAALRQHGLRAAHARRRARRTSSQMAHRLGIQSPLAAGAVDRPRHARRLAAGHGLGLRDPVRGRDLLAADGDHEGRAPGQQRGQVVGLGQAGAQARHPRGRRLRRHEDPRGERPVRDGHGRQLRDPRGRQDRARRTTTPTPGSSGTRPRWTRPSGSATRTARCR